MSLEVDLVELRRTIARVLERIGSSVYQNDCDIELVNPTPVNGWIQPQNNSNFEPHGRSFLIPEPHLASVDYLRRPKRFLQQADDDEDVSLIEGGFERCHECGKTFLDHEALLQHMASAKQHARRRTTSPMLKCEPCGKIFSGPDSHAQHVVSSRHIALMNKMMKQEDKGKEDNTAVKNPDPPMETLVEGHESRTPTVPPPSEPTEK